MTEYADKEQRIPAYLRGSVSRGEGYFRAKNIAEAIDLIAKQVGSRLPRLAERSEDVEVKKWGRTRSATWRVTRS